MGFFPATQAGGIAPSAVADPSSLDDTALIRYVRGLLVSVYTNVLQDGDTWIIQLKRRSDYFAPGKAKGTRDEIARRIARWVALRNNTPSFGPEFGERIDRILDALAGKRVEQARYNAKHKKKVLREKEIVAEIEAKRREAERHAREKRKLEGRPELYISGVRGREIHAWAATHVRKADGGFLPMEWAMKAQAADPDFGKTKYAEKDRAQIMEIVMHSLYNAKLEGIQGQQSWAGYELDDIALLNAFPDMRCA